MYQDGTTYDILQQAPPSIPNGATISANDWFLKMVRKQIPKFFRSRNIPVQEGKDVAGTAFQSKPHPVQARRQRQRLVDIQENLTNGLARATACGPRLIES